ncbi:MAG: hypothetical protein ACI9W2_002888, partial [Gammaproteobacteria bacterium]
GCGNGRVLIELPNRGRRRVAPVLNRSPASAPVNREAHPGDGFLFRHGYTVASIGWQWDVFRSESMMGLEAPIALRDGVSIAGQNMIEIRPNRADVNRLLADRVHRPIRAAAGIEAQTNSVLLVRDYEDGDDHVVPRTQWGLGKLEDDGSVSASDEYVYLRGGFEPGRIYQLVYTASETFVAGTGLLAMRDIAHCLRTGSLDEVGQLEGNPHGGFEQVLSFGVSQTGRMQKHFLHLGLNRCEDNSTAYDGMLVHVAGARRGSFNHRFSQPSNQTTPMWSHGFPFADVSSTDALTGEQGAVMALSDRSNSMPRIIYTNSAAEYWRGDAALAHIDTDGKTDLPEHPSTRSYLFSSVQHGAGYPGQSRYSGGIDTTSRYPLNVCDYRPLLRAALVNLDAWVSDGIEPPASRYPKHADNTAVPRAEVLSFFDTLPAITVPDNDRLPVVRTMDLGALEAEGVARFPAREGATYPALVSAIDVDGNEMAGIRLPDISVPVASHTGWNPRDPVSGASEQIVPMNGFTDWFCATKAERLERGDPRPSIEERYTGRDNYASKVESAARALVAEGLALAEDIDVLVEAAMQRYDAALAR